MILRIASTSFFFLIIILSVSVARAKPECHPCPIHLEDHSKLEKKILIPVICKTEKIGNDIGNHLPMNELIGSLTALFFAIVMVLTNLYSVLRM